MLDLFQLTEKVRGLGGMIARLDPSKSPVVPGGMKQNKATWTKLSTNIMSESKSTGKLLLVSNGSHGMDRMALVCSRYKRYEEKARRPKAGGKLRRRSINCDRNNARKAMESMKRKEQVPRRHYLVVMRLRARPSLCSESTQEASTSSVAMERMFTPVIHR
jgi:hypothetical protein